MSCCSIIEVSTDISKYKVFTKEQVLSLNKDEKKETEIYFFEYNYYSFAVTYIPYYYSIESLSFYNSHISFYALSKGFEKYTNTGYKSLFVPRAAKSDILSREEIEDNFLSAFKEIGLEPNSGEPVQLSLF